jgi:16S rRNA (adenine1518-N6/adenine1519-N6)-dimethyltransferase
MSRPIHRRRTDQAPNRAHGQHFLVQPHIASRIVERALLGPDDEVIEIGPGRGALTEYLARAVARRLVLVEIDLRLAGALKARFADDDRVTVIHGDFLALRREEIIGRPPVKVVSNLPFNSATAILERLSHWRSLIVRMVLMFQREVAERIRARPATPPYCALSALTALNWNVEEHFRVPAGNFFPRPKVDAEVLVLAPVSRPMEPEQAQAMSEVIRACFLNPRKTLRSGLSMTLKIPRSLAQARLEQARIEPTARPAQLALEDFGRLACALHGVELKGLPADA